MDVVNCRGCGKLFNAVTRLRLCPSCREKLEDKFQEVKRYINENSDATIEMVSQECGVTAKQIKQWVREERLSFSDKSMQGIECEQCGTMIRTGRFCNACKNKLQNEFKGASYVPVKEDNKSARDKDRMRFLQDI